MKHGKVLCHHSTFKIGACRTVSSLVVKCGSAVSRAQNRLDSGGEGWREKLVAIVILDAAIFSDAQSLLSQSRTINALAERCFQPEIQHFFGHDGRRER